MRSRRPASPLWTGRLLKEPEPITRRPDDPTLSINARAREQRLVARLNYLAEIGLVESVGSLQWTLRPDLEPALRTHQRATDRQKMIARNAQFLSNPNLQYRVVTEIDAKTEIDGKVVCVVHDDSTDQPHALIEGTNGTAYYVPLSSLRRSPDAKPPDASTEPKVPKVRRATSARGR